MLIYWIIFILSLIGVILDNGKAKNTLYFYFLLFCLVVICALRKESVGTDTPLYLMTIKNVVYGGHVHIEDLDYWGQGRDPQFWLVYGTVFLLTKSTVAVLLFHGVVHWAIVGSAIKKCTTYIFLALAVMIAFRFSDFYLNAMRQGISTALILFSYVFIRKRKIVYYIIIMTIAISLHGSSLLFLPAYWLYNISFKKITKKHILFIVIFGIAFSSLIYKYVLVHIFVDNYALYLDTESTHGLLYFILYLFAFVLCLINGNMKDDETKFLMIVCLVAVILQAATFSNAIFNRISAIFSIYFTLLIPRVTEETCIKSRSKMPLYLVAVMLLLLYIAGGPAPGVVPYKFFWE